MHGQGPAICQAPGTSALWTVRGPSLGRAPVCGCVAVFGGLSGAGSVFLAVRWCLKKAVPACAWRFWAGSFHSLKLRDVLSFQKCVCVGGAVRVPGQRHAGCCTLMPLIPSPSTPFPEASGWPEPVSSSGACAQWAVVLGVRAEPTPGTPVRASGEVGRGAPAVCGHPLLQEACPDHPRESSSGSRVAVFP